MAVVFYFALHLLLATLVLSSDYGPAPTIVVDGHVFQLPTPLVGFRLFDAMACATEYEIHFCTRLLAQGSRLVLPTIFWRWLAIYSSTVPFRSL